MPGAVAFPGVSVKPDTISIVCETYCLLFASVALSSASVTVTKSFNKSAVNVVPESKTFRLASVLPSTPL